MYTLTTRMLEEHPLLGTEPELLASLDSQYHFLKETPSPQTIYQKWSNINFKLSRTLRYQSYSLIQLATNSDQVQEEISSVNLKLTNEVEYIGMSPPILPQSEISIKLVNIFHQIAKDIPVIIVNEPIQIIENVPNSNIHYNVYYPRWAYDQYREYMIKGMDQYNWIYLDLWDSVTSEFFADSPLHLNREGGKIFADLISPSIQEFCLK